MRGKGLREIFHFKANNSWHIHLWHIHSLCDDSIYLSTDMPLFLVFPLYKAARLVVFFSLSQCLDLYNIFLLSIEFRLVFIVRFHTWMNFRNFCCFFFLLHMNLFKQWKLSEKLWSAMSFKTLCSFLLLSFLLQMLARSCHWREKFFLFLSSFLLSSYTMKNEIDKFEIWRFILSAYQAVKTSLRSGSMDWNGWRYKIFPFWLSDFIISINIEYRQQQHWE